MTERCTTPGIRSAACAMVALVLCASISSATPKPGVARHNSLFAGFLGRMNVNKWDCGLDATGHVCVDPNGSTTVGGGFWPRGTPDQYVFGSGIQVAGVVDPTLTSFPWHGDTTAAFFEDPSGTHENGSALSLIWQSTNPSDLGTWPQIAYVPNDTSLYSPVLIGQKTASQEDVWARYWDGDPNKNAGRPHPLGVLVEERGLAWNFPSGNEDIQYWIFTITNITASAGKVYAARPDADSLTSLGTRYAAAMSTSYKVTVPDTGYTIDSAYFAFSIDADVEASGATNNFATVNLPFNMGVAFKADWDAPDFTYPASIFASPFAPTVGEVGVKYLKSPLVNPGDPTQGQIGLLLFSATVNGGAFGDALNAAQVYRYLGGTLDPTKSDAPCNYAPGQPAKQVHVCYLSAKGVDIRFFQSSGPFTLKPGQSQTIAVAYIAAAPVDNINIKNHPVTFPSGGPFGPYSPQQPDALATGAATLNGLDSVFGALKVQDKNGDGRIEQTEYSVVPRSLLGKGLVAQAVFDAHFLLPFPPAPPDFYLLPGDNEVTITWRPSATDIEGDPYFVVASDPTSALYDPDYRRFDVEGYRIYRGRTSGDLQLVAQFDKIGTTFIDYTGQISSPNCAPELGTLTGCPVPFDSALTVSDTVPLVGDIIQVPPGGRVKLADSTILVLQADTASTGGGSGAPKLTDTGIPYAFVDKGVLNGFTYFYTVAAFDVNSVKSTGVGATTLEGKLPAKSVVPRKTAPNATTATTFVAAVGDDGTVLDSTGVYPAIDTTTGTFKASMPPVNGAVLIPLAPSQLLQKGTPGKVVIDSISAAFTGGIGVAGDPGYQPIMYVRFIGSASDTVKTAIPLTMPAFSDPAGTTQPFRADASVVPYDTALAKVLGLPSSFVDTLKRYAISFQGVTTPIVQTSVGIAPLSCRYGIGSTGARYLAHSRWFDEGAAEPANPTIVGLPDSAHNSGKLTGVGRIWAPSLGRDRDPTPGGASCASTGSDPAGKINRLLRGYAYGLTQWYPADFTITWNADSSISVRDVTHHVSLPPAPNGGAGWGFMNIRAYLAAPLTSGDIADGSGNPNVNFLTYHHIYGVPPMCYPDWFAINCITLQSKAQYEPIDFDFDGVADANGIGLFVNGEVFIMETSGIPAAGTKWHLRALGGEMSAHCPTATSGYKAVMTSCTGYKFTGATPRQPTVRNLSYTFNVTQTFRADSTKSGDLTKIHTVPDPYYVTNAFETSPNEKILKFVNLPSQCIIRIYSLSGVLVQMIAVNDASGGGEAQWDLRNRNNQFVASGVYFWHVEARDGQTRVGRFTIVNFAQ